ncbi:MAG: hypothetical protein ABDH49_02650 [Candidatus Hydrothermales bacterium]
MAKGKSLSCINCHFGIENKVSNFKDKEFAHGLHLFNYTCKTCHFESKLQEVSHGKLRKIARECNSCHHARADENCEKCHEIQKRFYSGEYLSSSPDYMKKAEVGCIDCHMQDKLIIRPSPLVCSNCHEEYYEENFRKDQEMLKNEMSNFERNVYEILKKMKD